MGILHLNEQARWWCLSVRLASKFLTQAESTSDQHPGSLRHSKAVNSALPPPHVSES
jgi:hypothetical protein